MAEKAGMVTKLDLPPGNYIKVGEPLFTMVTDDSWRAIAYFKETALHRIRTGQKAKIELVAYPGHVFHGVVQGVGWGITQQVQQWSPSIPQTRQGEAMISEVYLSARQLSNRPGSVCLKDSPSE